MEQQHSFATMHHRFLVACLLAASPICSFLLPTRISTNEIASRATRRERLKSSSLSSSSSSMPSSSSSSWSPLDDWDSLSNLTPKAKAEISRDWRYRDRVGEMAADIDASFARRNAGKANLSKEELWLEEALDMINEDDGSVTGAQPVGGHEIEKVHEKGPVDNDNEDFEDEMEIEIARLVRCNQNPEQMLMQQGRAFPKLTDEDRKDISYLVVLEKDDEGKESWKATTFFKDAVSNVFHQHCKYRRQQDPKDDESGRPLAIMDAPAVASWVSKSIGSVVGRYDRNVMTKIALFSAHGTGYLTEDNFQRLYLTAVIGNKPSLVKEQLASTRTKEISDVWRDLSNHDIESPAETERKKALLEMQAKLENSVPMAFVSDEFVDECEIVYGDEGYQRQEQLSTTTDREGRSSHERVELTPDNKTPLWMRDGQFVFIDEESCIGCMQCANAAPASFKMLENGRARTYFQSPTPDVGIAVEACPVDCMHYMSFRDLKDFETVRDNGDGRKDHRHFGYSDAVGYVGRKPLHMSRRTSNSGSSWYHHMRNKCYVSKECPQRGCYDCPMYPDPATNPHFKKRQDEAQHARAQFFMESGLADKYRKTADL